MDKKYKPHTPRCRPIPIKPIIKEVECNINFSIEKIIVNLSKIAFIDIDYLQDINEDNVLIEINKIINNKI